LRSFERRLSQATGLSFTQLAQIIRFLTAEGFTKPSKETDSDLIQFFRKR